MLNMLPSELFTKKKRPNFSEIELKLKTPMHTLKYKLLFSHSGHS